MGNKTEIIKIVDGIKINHLEELDHKYDEEQFSTHLNFLSKYYNYTPNFTKISLGGASEDYIKALIPFEYKYKIKLKLPSNEKLAKFTFEEKQTLLKSCLKELIIDRPNNKVEEIIVDRNNIIESSLEAFNKIDLYNILRVGFKNENIPYDDVGGLTREFITVLFKKLQDPKNGLFEEADSTDYSLKVQFKSNPSSDKLKKFYLIGKIMAKALLENFTINSYFNLYIYKIILDEPIKSEDLAFINLSLHRAIEYIETVDDIDDLELYFCENYEEDNIMKTYDLITNGSKIKVTKQTFDFYVEKRIELMVKNDKILINELKKGLFTYIPDKLLKIFNANELELILNGQPFIDVINWMENTEYKGYTKEDRVIKDFWSIIKELNQDKLENILQYSTGSRRVPLGGFNKMPTGQGNIGAFIIQKIDYIPNKENYIRAHTCFNRIELPNYPNKEELMKYILIMATEIPFFE